jgi:RNA polymerase sigma factor (sigma-70 family)
MNASDLDLLEEYRHRQSEDAFASLVRRHIDLVYSAALRQVRSPQLAEEIVQSVFVDLSRSSSRLKPDTILSAWLYQVTRRTAIDVIRRESRRQQREQIATEMNIMNAPDANWTQIEPLLDEAVSDLDETDRAAILLRYFENKSLREVGEQLGVSDDAAQKRVSRAVERLREFFSQRGVKVGASGLVVITANAVQAAPAGLALTVSTSVALAGTTIAAFSTATITKAIAMTTLQKTLVTTTVVILAGTGIYEARQASQLHDQVRTLQQQQTPLSGQIQQLQRERDDATNRLAEMLAENSRLRSNPNQTEILKLRGEAARLRSNAEQANDPVVKKALRWKANVEKMKLLFAEHPEQQVPEMKMLSDDYFFDLARDQDLDSSNGVRKAYSEIRQRAKNQFAIPLQQALKAFIDDNGGNLPVNVSDLKPYFKEPVDDAMLDQYKLIVTGKMSGVKGNFVLRDKALIDPELDDYWQIGPNAYGPDSSGHGNSKSQAMSLLAPALQSFMSANGGTPPDSLTQLKPYITSPEQQAAFDKLAKEDVRFGKPK